LESTEKNIVTAVTRHRLAICRTELVTMRVTIAGGHRHRQIVNFHGENAGR